MKDLKITKGVISVMHTAFMGLSAICTADAILDPTKPIFMKCVNVIVSTVGAGAVGYICGELDALIDS